MGKRKTSPSLIISLQRRGRREKRNPTPSLWEGGGEKKEGGKNTSQILPLPLGGGGNRRGRGRNIIILQKIWLLI